MNVDYCLVLLVNVIDDCYHPDKLLAKYPLNIHWNEIDKISTMEM